MVQYGGINNKQGENPQDDEMECGVKSESDIRKLQLSWIRKNYIQILGRLA